MKKYLSVAILSIILGVSVGCGNKTKVLDCNMTEEQSSGTIIQNIKSTFKKNEVINLSFSIEEKLSESYIKYVDKFISVIDSKYEKYNNKKGINVKTEKTNTGFVLKMDVDLKEMANEDKEELDMIDTSGDYNATKKYLEEQGYTCK